MQIKTTLLFLFVLAQWNTYVLVDMFDLFNNFVLSVSELFIINYHLIFTNK